MYDEKSLSQRMFDKVGEKIKILSQVLCWLGIIFSIILSIGMFIAASDSYNNEVAYMMLGFIYLVVGPIASWLSSLFIYGFGELISKTSNLEKHFCSNAQVSINNTQHQTNDNFKSFKCAYCGEIVFKGEPSCKKCGQFLDWSKIQ